jgi:hypothetical protein
MGSNWDIVRWAMEKCDYMQRRITCQGLDAGFYIYFSWGPEKWFDGNGMQYFPDFSRGKWRKWEPKQEPEYKCLKCQDSGVIFIEYTDLNIRCTQTCGCQIKQEPKTVMMWQPLFDGGGTLKADPGVGIYKEKKWFNDRMPVLGWIRHEVELVEDEDHQKEGKRDEKTR